MKRILACGSIALIAFSASRHIASADDPAPSDTQTLELGRKIFLQDWTKESAQEFLAPKADGLGPMFNAVSCVACHFQGTIGGGGPNDNNVQFVSLLHPDDSAAAHKSDERKAAVLDPRFRDTSDVFLHRNGTDISGDKSTYADQRNRVLGIGSIANPLTLRQPRNLVEGVWLRLVERNTTALFGNGLIDRIPESALIELENRQKTETPAIAGRRAGGGPSSVGRFGWRGQVGNLDDFIRGACAAELGLQTVRGKTQFPQTPDPLQPPPRKSRSRGPLQPDLAEREVNALIAFVRELPAPPAPNLVDDPNSEQLVHGYTLMNSFGCTACHVENVGPAKGIFSDLLLHDMGPKLADSIAAQIRAGTRTKPRTEPEFEEVLVNPVFSYYGRRSRSGGIVRIPKTPSRSRSQAARIAFKQETEAMQRAWKTPPLWGVADSAPYLHDGRAPTLLEAVEFHAGQALASRNRFVNASQSDQAALLAFLAALRAPTIPPRVADAAP